MADELDPSHVRVTLEINGKKMGIVTDGLARDSVEDHVAGMGKLLQAWHDELQKEEKL